MLAYAALDIRKLDAATTLVQARPWESAPVALDSPALSVMTDLTQVKAATTGPATVLPRAEQQMIYAGVRMLFVVIEVPRIVGLITATDLHGDRQMRLVHERGARYDELRVSDVMTPLAMLDAVDFERMQSALVGHVVATLELLGRNHLLVLERSASGQRGVRGVISRTQVERQLGRALGGSAVASTFADIERLLS